MAQSPADERSEIAFFDVETTVPTRSGEPFAILEFGAILVCPRKLVELRSYSTLVRPSDLSLISTLSVRRSGITRDGVISAPTFAEIADEVYDILDGRIWAGHNILRFDCARIREAFAEIRRSPPEPKATIDSLALLAQKFGRRAGDMKMASLAAYFGLGDQIHRSLDDARMNLEVLKYCATVLFLESCVPDILTANSWFSQRTSPRKRSDEKASTHGVSQAADSSSLSPKLDPSLSAVVARDAENHPIISLLTNCTEKNISEFVASGSSKSDPFDMSALINELNVDTIQPDASVEEKTEPQTKASSPSSGDVAFLGLDEVSISNVEARLVQFYRGSQKIKLFHNDSPLQLCCCSLRVRFGISRKFVDNAGRRKLNFVVDVPPNLCEILDACDAAARSLSIVPGRSSDWRPVVTRKNGFFNYPTAKLHIITVVNGDATQYGTDVYQKESSRSTQKLVFSKTDGEELEPLFLPGNLVDAFFSLDPYDYQQMAGIRLAAKKLVIHPKK